MTAEIVALVLLGALLVFAMLRPRGLPEATVALPAAGLAILLGLITPARAWARVVELGPTVGFLAAILVLAKLADTEGVFRWLGERLASASAARPGRLLSLVFVAASATTAVLSLDATVVLLTPVVMGTAARLRLRQRPHLYACAHLANSASLLLPVSNLTNLLAFAASGLSFSSFGLLMTLPWLAAIGAEYLVFRRFFAADLRVGPATGREPVIATERTPMPRLATVVLALTLLGFGLTGWLGVQPVWVAVLGVAVLAVRPLRERRITPVRLVRSAWPLFCLFVLALAIVVAAATANGIGSALAGLIPDRPTLLGLLGMAALAAGLANVINNLPATLALLGVMGTGVSPGLVLAMLLGVNIGPNLSYLGSLATLLWRRTVAGADIQPSPLEFTRLGCLTVPISLTASVLALWFGLTVGRGWFL
ncbi:MAG TPA: SLC13 family permease [Pseudonocardia sp.]